MFLSQAKKSVIDVAPIKWLGGREGGVAVERWRLCKEGNSSFLGSRGKKKKKL